MFWKDNSLSVGFFLAFREIKRSSPGTTALIIFVMTLTFFNMNLVGGVLLGIAHGVVSSYEQYYSSDVLITPGTNKNVLQDTTTISEVVKNLPTYQAMSIRYNAPALLEYGYQNKVRATDLSENTAGVVTGIDPVAENNVSPLAKAVVAGSYLNQSDVDEVLVGASLIKKYASLRGSITTLGSKILKTPDVGSKIRITVNGVQKEVFIKGIVSTQGTNMDTRVFMVDTTARELLGNTNLNASEIAIKLQPQTSQNEAKRYLQNNIQNNKEVLIQTSAEALPGGVSDIISTFTILGNLVGGIALIVGAITIFIVIFVNAITRRKYIGILKGIGITSRAVECSYIFQALFYAVSGIIIASFLALWIFVPYTVLHPIHFPVANGSLAITPTDLLIRGVILTLTALISGFIPAWLVTRQNTLDSILGR
ncbi:MAG: ABC transporter permease [Candidatus Levyibacteriota bacterium]